MTKVDLTEYRRCIDCGQLIDHDGRRCTACQATAMKVAHILVDLRAYLSREVTS